MRPSDDPTVSPQSTSPAPDTEGPTRSAHESIAALDAIADPVFVLDREHRILRLNRAAADLLGEDVDSLLGYHCYRFVHGTDEPIHDCPHTKVMADGHAHAADIDEPRLGGSVHISCSPLTDDEGRLLGGIHVLRTSRRRSVCIDPDWLLDAMTEQFAVLDPDLRILWANAATAAVTGKAVADLQGRPSHPACEGHDEIAALVSLTRDATARRLAEPALTESAERLRSALMASIQAIGAIIALRDPDTTRHQRRVTRLAQALATEMGASEDVIDGLWFAGQVLDIGKLGIPLDILGRPGALNERELALVRVHPYAARRILEDIPFERPVADAVGQHHERLDGSGYPDGLEGDEILFEARILAVADVVAAMTAHRPHRPALSMDEALAEVCRGSGQQFDAEVVAAAERIIAAGFILDESLEE